MSPTRRWLEKRWALAWHQHDKLPESYCHLPQADWMPTKRTGIVLLIMQYIPCTCTPVGGRLIFFTLAYSVSDSWLLNTRTLWTKGSKINVIIQVFATHTYTHTIYIYIYIYIDIHTYIIRPFSKKKLCWDEVIDISRSVDYGKFQLILLHRNYSSTT